MIESIKPSHSFPRGGFSFLLFFFPLWVAFSACKLLWGSYDFFFFSFSKPFTYLPIYLPTYLPTYLYIYLFYSILFYSILFYSITKTSRSVVDGWLLENQERARAPKKTKPWTGFPRKAKKKNMERRGMDGWMDENESHG